MLRGGVNQPEPRQPPPRDGTDVAAIVAVAIARLLHY